MSLKREHIIIPGSFSFPYALLTGDHTTLPPSIPLHLILTLLGQNLERNPGKINACQFIITKNNLIDFGICQSLSSLSLKL